MNTFWKGLLAAIIGTIATLFAVQGATVWFYVITVVGVVITYFVQHGILKPISIFGTIDVTDLIKGLLMAIGTAISTYAADLISGIAFDWMILLKVVIAAVVLYLGKNFASDSKGNFARGRKEYQRYRNAA